MNRLINVTTALGDRLRFSALSGREEISHLFDFSLTLKSEDDDLAEAGEPMPEVLREALAKEAGECRYASYHTDHLGTPLALTDEQGKLLWEASPDDCAAVGKQQSNTAQPIRYQGQYEDEESGLYYNRRRYYDPLLGRYVNQDPIGLLGGVNNYAYPHAPAGWVDPMGLKRNGSTHTKQQNNKTKKYLTCKTKL